MIGRPAEAAPSLASSLPAWASSALAGSAAAAPSAPSPSLAEMLANSPLADAAASPGAELFSHFTPQLQRLVMRGTRSPLQTAALADGMALAVLIGRYFGQHRAIAPAPDTLPPPNPPPPPAKPHVTPRPEPTRPTPIGFPGDQLPGPPPTVTLIPDPSWSTVIPPPHGEPPPISPVLMAQRSGDGIIPTIRGRKPINSRYAGRKHPSGVEFTPQGFPIFGPHVQKQIQVANLNGDRRRDERLANKKAGYRSTPAGYVWHHVEDGITMQLVPRTIHKSTKHTGGAAIIRNGGFD